MQKSIMAIIPSIVFGTVHEQLEKHIVVIISDGNH